MVKKTGNFSEQEVSIVKCTSYKQSKVDTAIRKSFKLLKIEIPKNKKILIKPNLISADVKNPKATYTQPQIIGAICKILKKNNCKIYIGESSFMNTGIFFKKAGYDKIAKKYGAKLVIFEQDKLVRIKNSKNKILKEFPIAKSLKEVDYIINVPKLKTHSLMKITGAIKNLYGVIPGGLKQKLHTKADKHSRFAKLLVDIFENLQNKILINIMDGVIGMEGVGPTSGCPKKSNLILASKNSVSLDIIASKIIGYKPKEILPTKEAVKRKLGHWETIILGSKRIPLLNFKKPYVRDRAPRAIRNIFKGKPIVVDKTKCIKCGLCARKCPQKAITLKPYPIIDTKKCIRCFCCMEICPQHALGLKGKN